MSQKLIQIAAKYSNVFCFIADFQRTEKNAKNGSGVRELAKIYYRAHLQNTNSQ